MKTFIGSLFDRLDRRREEQPHVPSSSQNTAEATVPNTPAQLLALSKFLKPRLLSEVADLQYMRDLLGDEPKQVLEAWVATGYLEECPLRDRVEFVYKVPDLKALLRERSLPTTGKKKDLIDRLLATDVNGMTQTLANVGLVHCSQRGMMLAETYLREDQQRREDTEAGVREALARRDFSKASELVAAFEATQPIPRGINMQWSRYQTGDEERRLAKVFAIEPDFVRQLDALRLEQLRIATGQVMLWSKWNQWLPDDFDTGLPWSPQALARALEYRAQFLVERQDWRDLWANERNSLRIEIRTCNDHLVCEACAAIADRKWDLDHLPELPYAKCTCEDGCRCWALPVFD